MNAVPNPYIETIRKGNRSVAPIADAVFIRIEEMI